MNKSSDDDDDIMILIYNLQRRFHSFAQVTILEKKKH